MARNGELENDPEAVEIIERVLIAGGKTDAVNAALASAGKSTTTKQNVHQSWMNRPNVVEGVKATKAAILQRGYGDRLKRVKKLESLMRRMDRVINEREAAMVNVAPGGGSGLLAEDIKSIGGGEHAREVSVYRVDTSLIKEMRETLKHIAIENGEWMEKRDITSNGSPLLSASAISPELDAKLNAVIAGLSNGTAGEN